MKQNLTRWRLILGQDTEDRLKDMNNNEPMLISEEDFMLENALSSLYNSNGQPLFNDKGAKGGGKGNSSPSITKWLGDIKNIFDKDIVNIIQNDAIEKYGLKELIFEPEIIEDLEPNINLAKTIMLLKEQIPKNSKESVRIFIRKVVEDINKRLADDVKRSVTASVNKKQHSPIPSSAIDFKYTIRKNLKNYNEQLNTIIPEKVYFYERASNSIANKWQIILDIDQSGSMGESVLYSSVLSCLLASISSIKTNVVAFDTNIVDLSDKCEDPVDLLFGFTLGGGTDINKSIEYCQRYIENPKKTLFFLISDLEEGGNRAAFLRRLENMKQDGVIVICLLAISDEGKPYYDANMAKKIANMNIPCFACNPQKLPLLLECVLKGKDISKMQSELEKSN